MVTSEQVNAANRALSLINLFKPWALAFVAVGVAYEFIADRLEKPYNRTVEIAHDEEMGRLRESTALAQKATADLLTIIAPRDLNEGHQRNIRKALMPFSGETVFIRSYPGDGEAARLILEIKSILEPAIRVEDRTGELVEQMAPSGFIFGIQIDASRDKAAFAEALVAAFSGEGKLSVQPLSPFAFGDSPTDIKLGIKPPLIATSLRRVLDASEEKIFRVDVFRRLHHPGFHVFEAVRFFTDVSDLFDVNMPPL